MLFSSVFLRRSTHAALRSKAFPAKFLTTASAPVKPSQLAKYGRRIAYTAGFVGLGYVVDNQFYASTFTRNFKTLYTCAIIVADYKFNFTQEKSAQIEDLHTRVAQRLFDLFTGNGGLYIKFGQAIGANAALLPKPMQLQFSRLFDDAPSLPFGTISRVLSAEFGRPLTGPDGLFASFEEEAIASASIAQVHRALLHDGTQVAVKIQKPAVAKQMEPDLLAFRAVLWAYEWYFELPTFFVVDFISDHLRQELDFEREAINGRKTAELLGQDSRLRGKVHVPRIYGEHSSRRVLTTEWIDGVRLSNREAVMALMGEGDAHRLPTASQKGYADATDSNAPISRLPLGVEAPLKGGVKWVMRTMTDFFGAAIFRYGWVHADPHPGNFLLRPHPNPSYKGEPQLVLLDHGLYVRLNPKFQRQYAELWKGLLAVDMNTVRRVALEWGIGAPDVFASATLLRPMRVPKDGNGKKKDGETKQLSQYELSIKMKERLKSFLTDTDKLPKELVFIGRNMRMVQGNNQMFGSPVNRVKITAYAAADSLPRAHGLTIAARAREYLHQATFYIIMFALDTAFFATQAKNWFLRRQKKRGFEDELEAQMAQMMKREYGVEVDPAMFEA